MPIAEPRENDAVLVDFLRRAYVDRVRRPGCVERPSSTRYRRRGVCADNLAKHFRPEPRNQCKQHRRGELFDERGGVKLDNFRFKFERFQLDWRRQLFQRGIRQHSGSRRACKSAQRYGARDREDRGDISGEIGRRNREQSRDQN